MSTASGSRKIGFIGLGLMGRPMAMNLLKAGHSLTIWNRTAARADELVAAGAVLAKTPRAVAEKSDVLISIVSDPQALESVLWGQEGKQDGALGGLKKGSVYIDSSTVSPTLVKKISAACDERGVRFLDAPVTGGDWGAREGNLVFMIGGEAETLKEVEPILGVMGKKWFHLGPNGAGQTIKLAMNAILALEVGAVAEAIGLVTRAGLAGEQLLEVLQASMGRSGLLDLKTPLMLKGDFKPSFPLRLMHKDLGLALDLANQLGVALPTTAAVREVYNFVKGEAKEDVDYSAVMRFYKK
ncbi:MAG TPA: NAD(P)-dependent oxidoreductase [Candidatus Acidoferrales bacterium]|nr:NAD(P)-dependent oxidoreductase [Candidatus Acidoferrales bacterium]